LSRHPPDPCCSCARADDDGPGVDLMSGPGEVERRPCRPWDVRRCRSGPAPFWMCAGQHPARLPGDGLVDHAAAAVDRHPDPCAAASRAGTSHARSRSAGAGRKTRSTTGTCRGWMQARPTKPRRRS
jgi:hypothetical protein